MPYTKKGKKMPIKKNAYPKNAYKKGKVMGQGKLLKRA